mgnify:CR=1 FL=1
MDTLKAILLKEQEDLESVLREIESDEFDVKESSAESAIEISDMADQFEERQNPNQHVHKING